MVIEIHPVPKGPLGRIWDERVRDWVDEAPHYIKLYLNYREQYYKKICSKCTHAQKTRRKCTLLIPGFDEQHCRHIDLAFASKYRTMIRRRYESHPFMQRIRWNMELEKGRKGEPHGRAAGSADTATGAASGAPRQQRQRARRAPRSRAQRPAR